MSVPATEQDAASKAFFVWRAMVRRRDSTDLDVLDHPLVLEAWGRAWKDGGWDAIRRNSGLGLNLSQIIQRLEELAATYGDREVEREFEAISPYWHTKADE